MLTEEMRAPSLARGYWNHPNDCPHTSYRVEYLTAATATGYCRGCGCLRTGLRYSREQPHDT
jgi:hypothetical protein